jgi:hypothetical protein
MIVIPPRADSIRHKRRRQGFLVADECYQMTDVGILGRKRVFSKASISMDGFSFEMDGYGAHAHRIKPRSGDTRLATGVSRWNSEEYNEPHRGGSLPLPRLRRYSD